MATMYATTKLSLTCTLLSLGLACGGKSSSNNPDARGMDGGPVGGTKGDTRVASPDVPRATDGRDAAFLSDSSKDINRTIDAAADRPQNEVHREDGRTDAPLLDGSSSLDARDTSSSADGTALLDSRTDVPLGSPDGAKDTQPIDAPPPPNSCLHPMEIPNQKNLVEITLDTTTETHDFTLPCGTGGNDVVFYYYSALPKLVYADTFGASWNTMLFLSDTCPPTPLQVPTGQVACSDDACGTSQSQVYAQLQGGQRYYLILSGANGAAGSVTLRFQTADVNMGDVIPLPVGTGTLTGSTSGNGRSILCEASGPENVYWWATCPSYAGGPFSASTCNAAAFDVVLALQLPKVGNVVCANGDVCGMQEKLNLTIPPGAGLHALVVDGDTSLHSGAYTLTYTRP